MKPQDGYWGSLTPEQTKTFEEFKTTIAKMSVEVWKYDLAGTRFNHYDYLRFLRARKFNLKKTMEMFEKYIKWRKEFGVDQVLVQFRP